MALSDTLNGAAAVVSSVTGSGRVYARTRRITTRAEMLSLAVPSAGTRVNMQTVTRTGTDGDTKDGSLNLASDAHRIEVRCWYQVDDADDTETTFQTFIEAVRAAFWRDRSLGTSSARIMGRASVRIPDKTGTRTLGGVLCHYAEITFPVTEYVSDASGSL